MAAGVLFPAGSARSQSYPQWKQIATLPGTAVVIYFSDTLHGIVCSDTGTIPGGALIFYTMDQTTWHSAVYPPITQVNAIRSINGKLYAATTGSDLLVSTDSGATWNYSGLGLADAWDVFQDPSGTIRILSGPYYQASFARADMFHCMATQSVGEPLLSGDGGVTWYSSGFNGTGLCGMGDYGDTCKDVLMFTDFDESVYRSTNHGFSWQQSLASAYPGQWAPNFLEGGAGVVYCTGARSGLTRSTNDGESWTTIAGSPSSEWNVLHIPIFGVLGQNVVFPDGFGNIWITTTGGDGTLADPITSPDSLPGVTSSGDTTSVISQCGGVRIPVPMLVQAADSTLVQASIVSDSLHEFSIADSNKIILRSGVNDTMWVEYSPHAQPATTTLTLNFQNSWRCSGLG